MIPLIMKKTKKNSIDGVNLPDSRLVELLDRSMTKTIESLHQHDSMQCGIASTIVLFAKSNNYELYLSLGNISVYNRNCNNVFCY